MSGFDHVKGEVLAMLRRLASPESLRELEYEEYLQTPHWEQMKRIAKAASSRSLDPRCQLCGCDDERVAFQVHHNTYKRLGQEDTLDLIVLCIDCHRLFHESKKLWEKTPALIRETVLQMSDETRMAESPESAPSPGRVPPKGNIR